MAIEKAPFEQTPMRWVPELRMPGWLGAGLLVALVLVAGGVGGLVMAEVSARPLQVQIPGITTPVIADTIMVVGEGRVAAVPDTIYTDIGAETRQPTLAQALAVAADDATKLTTALKGAGVAGTDIQTTSLSTWTPTDQYGNLLGYSVATTMRVRIRDVSKASTILNAAAGAIGNEVRLGQLEYDRADIAPQAAQARQLALAAAQDRASGLAKLSNRSLGKITAIQENFVGYVPAGSIVGGQLGGGGKGGGGGGGSGLQIQSGQGEVVVQLAASYALN